MEGRRGGVPGKINIFIRRGSGNGLLHITSYRRLCNVNGSVDKPIIPGLENEIFIAADDKRKLTEHACFRAR